MTIRYGFIGAGMMAQEHMRNLALFPEAEITAIADPDQGMQSMAAPFAPNAKQYADYKELLSANSVDAWIVATPNDTHHQILLDTIETNTPILCEKPICTEEGHVRAVMKAAQDKAPIWVGMEYRYMPPIQRLLEEVRNNTAGDIRMLSIREHRFPFLPKVADWNRFADRSGGTMIEKCCHFWDLMRLILQSDPVRVFCSGAMDVNHRDEEYEGRRPDVIDNAFTIVDFANGARAMLDLCMFAEASHWQEILTATGPLGRITSRIPRDSNHAPDGVQHHAEISIADRSTLLETTETVTVDEKILQAGAHHGSTFYQHEKFIELVLKGSGLPEVSLNDGLWSVRVGAAAEESAATGRPVELAS